MMGITLFLMASSEILKAVHSRSLKSDFRFLDGTSIKEGRLAIFK